MEQVAVPGACTHRGLADSGPMVRGEQRGGSIPHQQRSSAPRTGNRAQHTAHHHVQIRNGEGGFGVLHISCLSRVPRVPYVPLCSACRVPVCAQVRARAQQGCVLGWLRAHRARPRSPAPAPGREPPRRRGDHSVRAKRRAARASSVSASAATKASSRATGGVQPKGCGVTEPPSRSRLPGMVRRSASTA